MKRLVCAVAAVCLASACCEKTTTTAENIVNETSNAFHHLQADPLPAGPQLFLEGIVTTGDNEFAATTSPDGTTYFFCRGGPVRGNFHTILYTEFRDGAWSEPEIPSFAGRWLDVDPVLSPDGETIYFSSSRPLPGEEEEGNYNLWMARKIEGGWSEAQPLPDPVNSDETDIYAAVAASGNIYFGSEREGGFGAKDIWMSEYREGAYSQPVNLGSVVNSSASDSNPFIDPQERFLIFATEREDSFGGVDLYISHRIDGVWGEPVNLGPEVNTAAAEFTPWITSDGKYLIFGRTGYHSILPPNSRIDAATFHGAIHGPQNGMGDLYIISTSTISQLVDK